MKCRNIMHWRPANTHISIFTSKQASQRTHTHARTHARTPARAHTHTLRLEDGNRSDKKKLCASVYMCLVVTCWERADILALDCGVKL